VTGAGRGDLRPPEVHAGERETLLTFLDYLRAAVASKLAGVSAEAAREPGVPSGTSLLWLVKHLTAVELNWFGWAYQGVGERADDEPVIRADDEPEELLAAYADAVARANAVVRGCADLERPGARSLRETAPPSLRWILVHMIEETARHAGHADIIRERQDGVTGR
jgi:uncharacterized damage-inducible protein DinB